jgi:hypothetical protein
MKRGFALTTLPGIGGRELKTADARPAQIGDCAITVFCAPPGAGQTTLFEQFATLHSRAVIDCPSDPNVRTLRDAMFSAIVGDESIYFGSVQSQSKAVRELRNQGGPLLIFDNADRLAKPALLDLVQDLGDSSGSPIVLSCRHGRRGLRELLEVESPTSDMAALVSRIDRCVELPGPSLQDAIVLARELMEIEVDDELIAHIFAKNGTSVRSLLRAFRNCEESAMSLGRDRLDIAQWCAIIGETIEEQPKLVVQRKALQSPASAIHQAVKAAVRAA